MRGSFKLPSTMHRFLLPKCPHLEESLRNESNVEEEMPGVSDVDFEEEECRGKGGQPSTTTEGANHGASSISGISMNAQDGSTSHVWSPTKEFL